MIIDKEKANAAIDEYIGKLREYHASKTKLTSSLRSNYVASGLIRKHEIVKEVDLLDHLVLWTAMLAITKRYREVWKIENECEAVLRRGKKSVSPETFIRRLKDDRSRDGRGSAGARFRQHLKDSQ